jgi:hypothetical protein
MKIVPKIGDVFLIPLDEEFAAGGHVIATRENEELYLAVFGQRVRRDETDLGIAIAGKPVLLTLSFDAKFSNGDWPIIGNLVDFIERYPEPAFKIKHAGEMSIESRDKSRRRPVTADEAKMLQYRSVASPAIVQDAIRAHFGIGEWSESYDKRRAEYAIETSKMI